ncbi:MAG: diacylglycerol kinase family lipid kinase [bacterium]|nr:diacylglycerol kinase family lipid kinase [bacterium]
MQFNGSFAVILNPQAGAGRGCKHLEELRSFAVQRGGQLVLSSAPGQSIQLARHLSAQQIPLIFAAGGDDTIREVLRGLPRSHPPRLGIIPVGTFNNFATSLHLPEEPLDALAQTLLGKDTSLDLGKVENGPFFIESVGVGLDSEAWSQAPQEEPIGMARWFTGIRVGFSALTEYVPKHLRIAIDGHFLNIRSVMQVIVANSRCFGARLQIAPKARLDDGLLDVCIIPPMSRAKLLTALPLFFYGKQLDYLPSLRYYQCHKITISARKKWPARVDGLLAEDLPITIRALPKSLPVRLPAACFNEDGKLR